MSTVFSLSRPSPPAIGTPILSTQLYHLGGERSNDGQAYLKVYCGQLRESEAGVPLYLSFAINTLATPSAQQSGCTFVGNIARATRGGALVLRGSPTTSAR